MITVRLIAIDLDDVAYVSVGQEIYEATREEVISQIMNDGATQTDFICIKTVTGVISIPKGRIKSLDFIVSEVNFKED